MRTDYFSISQQLPELKILNMISSVWVAQLIQVSLKKNLLSEIAKKSCSLNDLSEKVRIPYSTLNRILRGLEHLLLVKIEDEKYQITELGALLLPETPGSFYEMASLWGDEFFNSWGKILETVEQGRAGFEIFYHQTLFEYLMKNPERATFFDKAMASLSAFLYPEVAKHISIPENQTVADIGGGGGFLLSRILIHNPNSRGILFDLERVTEKVELENPIANHFEIISGDFFSEVPSADNYVLSNILHDWNDIDASIILKKIRKKLKKEGKLYIVEMVVDHKDAPLLSVSTDLNMMMLTGGKERTLNEFSILLSKNGYQIIRLKNIHNMVCLIEVSIKEGG